MHTTRTHCYGVILAAMLTLAGFASGCEHTRKSTAPPEPGPALTQPGVDPGLVRFDRFTELTPWLPPPSCDDVTFPTANDPDGCRRILLTQRDDGTPFDAKPADIAVSRDGRWAALTIADGGPNGSGALAGDVNGLADIYLVDLDRGALRIASRDAAGDLGNGNSSQPSLSEDGRFVAFTTSADNIAGAALEQISVVVVRDNQTGQTVIASISPGGDLPDRSAYGPRISADGRHVAFLSASSNLVSGDNNGRVDLFVRDLVAHRTRRVSVGAEGEEMPEDSGPAAGVAAQGRFVLFTHPSALTPDDHDDTARPPSERTDVYLWDGETGVTTLISRHAPNTTVGARAVALSEDGERALFSTVRADLYLTPPVIDPMPGTVLAIVGVAPTYEVLRIGDAAARGMSDSARFVAFTSARAGYVQHTASTIMGLHTQSGYVRDRQLRVNALVNAAEDGRPATIANYVPSDRSHDWIDVALSGDGMRAVFSTIQYGVVDEPQVSCDTPRTRHVYLRDCR